MNRETTFFAEVMPTKFPDSKCENSDVNFFPTPSESEEPARNLCRTCPNQSACLIEALKFEAYGIWGNTNEAERNQIIQAVTTRNGGNNE